MVSWSNGTVGLNQSEDYVIVTAMSGEVDVVSMLTIIGADPFDAAAYTCTVTNVGGLDMSLAYLTVHGEVERTVSLSMVLLYFSHSLPL